MTKGKDLIGMIVCPIGSPASLGVVTKVVSTYPPCPSLDKVEVLWLSREPERSDETAGHLRLFTEHLDMMRKRLARHEARYVRMQAKAATTKTLCLS